MVAMATPATTGPTTRPRFMRTLLSVTALASRSGPTISMAKVWRAGTSRALTKPSSSAATNVIQRVMAPVATRTPTTSAIAAADDCVRKRMRRLSMRSTITPATGPSRRSGRYWSAAVAPSTNPEPPSCSTSQVSAIACIQVPLTERAWPMK